MKKLVTLWSVVFWVTVLSTTFAALPDFSTQVLPWMSSNGLTKYTSSVDFRAEDSIVRGEAAKFVASFGVLKNIPQTFTACTFTDLDWYDSTLTPHIQTACSLWLLKGGNGKFSPNATLTEAQALAIVIRSVAWMQDETMSPWYKAYFTKAQALGLITNETLTSINTTQVTRAKLWTRFYLSTEEGMKMVGDDTMKDDTMMQDDAMMKKPWMYTDYSADAVKTALAEGKKVALFFHASRCPSCVSADKDLLATTLPDNSIVFKVNYDTSTDLKVTYGVTTQHTFVFLDKDMQATSKNPGLGIAEVVSMLQ
jgi:hypothetical protein